MSQEKRAKARHQYTPMVFYALVMLENAKGNYSQYVIFCPYKTLNFINIPAVKTMLHLFVSTVLLLILGKIEMVIFVHLSNLLFDLFL
jgi:hypothetical protein